jgi:hypothetical protein
LSDNCNCLPRICTENYSWIVLPDQARLSTDFADLADQLPKTLGGTATARELKWQFPQKAPAVAYLRNPGNPWKSGCSIRELSPSVLRENPRQAVAIHFVAFAEVPTAYAVETAAGGGPNSFPPIVFRMVA